MKNKLTKNQQLVMNQYNLDPNCVNEEQRLLERVWLTAGWDDTKSLYWNLQHMPHAESISRARRKLHELGLIVYSKDADSLRYDAYKNDVNMYSSHEKQMAAIVKPIYMEITNEQGERIMVKI